MREKATLIYLYLMQLTSLTLSHHSRSIQVTPDGGYTNVIVVIHEDVPEDPNLLYNIQVSHILSINLSVMNCLKYELKNCEYLK